MMSCPRLRGGGLVLLLLLLARASTEAANVADERRLRVDISGLEISCTAYKHGKCVESDQCVWTGRSCVHLLDRYSKRQVKKFNKLLHRIRCCWAFR